MFYLVILTAEFDCVSIFQQQCDKYWGDILSVQKYVRQGDIHIHLKETLELSKLVIRTFQIHEVSISLKNNC